MAIRRWIGMVALGVALALPTAALAQDGGGKTKTATKGQKTKAPKSSGKAEKSKGSSGGAAADESVTDSWITMKIKTDVSNESTLKGSDITVETKGGVVSLKGAVESGDAKARAEEIAKKTQGVTKVIDNLTVKTK